ncbi:ribonucleotide reductase subunit alpha [Shewanella aestuarii]|uniref:Ribonucleotide reductase subunit alpha n=1 Tax=Shewanella aestuarii TaxID=1028752 RepID=A0A6G9QPS0_9GAMM|nr:ribonucleotide reductase subunit alpha [Shewanella aestuarii]QIR16418.1 ribonucleotide reductase subunit alpha [Shewanella aestuarii]
MSALKELISMANYQGESVKLLFLFAKAEYAQSDNGENKGHMIPLMCVDKYPKDLSDFAGLCDEADNINSEWEFIFVTSMLADVDQEALDNGLKRMASDIENGENTAMYVVLDRQENVIEMMRS